MFGIGIGVGLVGLAAAQSGWIKTNRGHKANWSRSASIMHRPPSKLLTGMLSIAHIQTTVGWAYQLMFFANNGRSFELAQVGSLEEAKDAAARFIRTGFKQTGY